MMDPLPCSTAPERTDPPFDDNERRALEAWLEFHRATLLTKCVGLSAEQLGQRAVPPSTLSLRGLLRHLTEVERYWFADVFAGRDPSDLYCTAENPDGDHHGFDPLAATASEEVRHEVSVLDEAITTSREIARAHESLDELSVRRRDGEAVTLRWIFLHLIEEYARHNGHADLLRECLDGTTGE
ncbi:DinB family protein [Arthrobacter rhombi]|uniref:DinB family protein n=1 Tax=Arthrobacter rhombi TaxID=71253 RepID=UPI003F8FD6C8